MRRQRATSNPSEHGVLSSAIRSVMGALQIGGFAGLVFSIQAGLSIDLPEVGLLPNTPDQAIDVYLRNTGEPIPVLGIGFNIQVADGGPPLGGKTNGPAITSVDIFTGTIFASNNNGLSGSGSIVPQLYERGTLTRSNTVSIPTGLSKVATVTLDTTGFSSGTFGLTLNTVNGRTKYPGLDGDLFPALVDGRLTVGSVPVITVIAIRKPDRVGLSFSTSSGFNYRVQRAPRLRPNDWMNVPHSVAIDGPLEFDALKGTGATLTLFVERPSDVSTFYRLTMEGGED